MTAGNLAPLHAQDRAGHARFGHVLRAEWTKFRTVRGWVAGMVAAALVTVLFGVLFTFRSRGPLRPASLRRTLLGATVIGSMMLTAGCHTGPGPQHTEVDGGGKTPHERVLAIAQCMRHNGDPAFPDPGKNGAFPTSAHENQSSPSYQAAVRACQGLPRSGVGNAPF